MPVNSARSCGGRRPSSTWPAVTPPRAPASVWDHRWRSRWHFAALLGGGWAVPDGAKTSTTPSRWPDTATRTTLAAVVAWTYGFAMQYGVLRADDSAVRAIEEAVQTAEGASNDRRTELGRVHVGCRAAESGRRGRPSPRAGADGAGPRHLAARACSLPGPGHRVVGRPGEGQARRPRCCHCGDAQSRGRAAPGRTARVWRLGHRRSGGDAAGAWRRGRPGRSPRGDRPVGEPAGRSTVRRCARSRCCGCARCWPGPAATTLPTGTW